MGLRPHNWLTRQHLVPSIIGGVGTGTFLLHLSHLLVELDEIQALILGVIPPMMISLALVAGGYWLWQDDLDETYHPRLLVWVGGGILGIGGIGISVILYQIAHETPQTDAEFMVINWLTTGTLAGFLIGVYDAKRRAALESLQQEHSALKEHEQELQRENERLDRFAAILSHDLRNPLNVAQGRLELLEETTESEQLDAIARALDRMEAIITDVLTMVRQGKNVPEEDWESIDLAACAESCWKLVETANAELRIEDTATVRADQSRLREVFENLFRNAVEHGGEDVTVVVGTLPDGFYIADSGPGIPESERTDVFEAGYSTSQEGTGFGLNIVQQIVDAHEWTIRVTDSESGGARFEITDTDFADT